MALIKCSECGKEISDKARECIHCGNPVREYVKESIKQNLKEEENFMSYEEYKKSKQKDSERREISTIGKIWLIYATIACVASIVISVFVKRFNIRDIVISILMAWAYYSLYKNVNKKNLNNVVYINILSVLGIVFSMVKVGMMLSTMVISVVGSLINVVITYLVVKNKVAGQTEKIDRKYIFISTAVVILTYMTGFALNFIM